MVAHRPIRSPLSAGMKKLTRISKPIIMQGTNEKRRKNMGLRPIENDTRTSLNLRPWKWSFDLISMPLSDQYPLLVVRLSSVEMKE